MATSPTPREHKLQQRLRAMAQSRSVLEQQRALLGDAAARLPTELTAHYRELLRTYVIMGSGNLTAELKRLAEMLVIAGLGPHETLQLHLHVLSELVHGLGSRSTRHVMNRADLLAIELLLHVGDGYRRRYQERIRPPIQKRLF